AREAVRLERRLLPDGRVLVHDYGHGGAGVTVAWGCARKAAALAFPTP
ncbi:amino acid oxidase, partial [Streptomyces sp. NPDC004457]